ncbi:hypothetical protein GGR50DRAFT_53759 [Xylaria sp. CBS 124048]|nr:hypothetical protein GGR50DRAFT_53759 [Xylaria sp. CBS 124048]
MASQDAAPPSAPDVTDTPPQPSIQDATKFFDLLKLMANYPSTAWVVNLLQDNKNLKAATEKQGGINNGLTLALGKCSQDLVTEREKSERTASENEASKAKASELTTQIEEAIKRIAEKDEQLNNDASAISGLKTDVENLNKDIKARDELVKQSEERQAQDNASINELKEELGSTTNKLVTTSDQLKELEDLSWDMGSMASEEILSEITKIYGDAKHIATKYFGQELPTAPFQDPELIADIQRLVRPIPLLPSNTPAARKSRIAAFMNYLSSKLVDQIFVPCYYNVPQPGDEYGVLQQHGTDVTFLLSMMSEDDPKRELHLRSVLIAAFPEKQKEIARKRAKDIAEIIGEDFGGLLGDETLRAQLLAEMKSFCESALTSWEKLRVLKVKVEPFTDAEDSEKYWLPAELDIGGVARSQSPIANGAPKRLNPKPSGLGLSHKPSLTSLTGASRVTLFWPGFCYGTNKDVLRPGYMLLDSQIKQANEEAHSRRSHRALGRASTPQHLLRRSSGRKSRAGAAVSD